MQTQRVYRVAVALAKAGGCSSDWTLSLGTSMCGRSGPRKGKKTKQTKKQVKFLTTLVWVSLATYFLQIRKLRLRLRNVLIREIAKIT